jgi:curved DNA-binding protein CbpA
MAELHLTDYYEVLQVSPRADRDTIERVYRFLANRYHPDNRETGDAERFSELVDAYRVLSDAVERSRYDQGYEKTRESRWKLFGQETVGNEIASDSRIRQAMMSILYVARRNSPIEPGVGSVELERLLDVPDSVIRFHLWYMRECNWICRLDTGHLAITALGVDKLFELGGLPKTHTHLLRRGNTHTPRGLTALEA